MNKNSKIFVSGHNGLVGSSILRKLKKLKYKNIITVDKAKLNLRDQNKVDKFFKTKKIEYVINAAAKVGGILANKRYKADYLIENIQIQNNVISSSYKFKVKSLIFLGSSCIYPKFAKQPIKEEYLLTSKLEPTNEPYAIAKIAGVKLCEAYNYQYKTDFKCLMPSNLFGPNDNYDLENSHLLPAVIKKLYLAKSQNKKEVIFWGTGKPKREMTYVDEIADACIFFLQKKTKHSLINIGSGFEKPVKEFILLIAKKMNLKSKIIFNNDKTLDGTPRKIIDCKIARSYGWKSKYNFNKCLDLTIEDFIKNKKKYLS